MKTKRRQNWLVGAVVILLCFIMAGCGHEHTWVEATCKQPRTCSECGETEGEALGHTWVDVTCTEPKHCYVCGETEGEALGHTLTGANYQKAATCEVCGETEGEPLPADFEKYGLECNAELNVSYPCITRCSVNADYTTTGELLFYDYQIFESNERHEAMKGYEWRAVTFKVVYDDDNARAYGTSTYHPIVDYYDSSVRYSELSVNDSIDWNGTKYLQIACDRETKYFQWDDSGIFTYIARIYCRVPIGYDGVVICFADGKYEELFNNGNIGEAVAENTIFFRMDSNESNMTSDE